MTPMEVINLNHNQPQIAQELIPVAVVYQMGNGHFELRSRSAIHHRPV